MCLLHPLFGLLIEMMRHTCFFYRDSTPRCRIVDMHLKVLATKHLEARFCKVNAERCPFLTERLRIKVIPSIALIKDSKTKDYIVGFTDLGNCDDFSTEMLEWRIAQSGAIEYSVSGGSCTCGSLVRVNPTSSSFPLSFFRAIF